MALIASNPSWGPRAPADFSLLNPKRENPKALTAEDWKDYIPDPDVFDRVLEYFREKKKLQDDQILKELLELKKKEKLSDFIEEIKFKTRQLKAKHWEDEMTPNEFKRVVAYYRDTKKYPDEKILNGLKQMLKKDQLRYPIIKTKKLIADDWKEDMPPEVFKRLVSFYSCLLYTSPSPRDKRQSRMPSSA